MAESLKVEAMRALHSRTCVCGAPKAPNNSFCKACYYCLPANIRQRLYRWPGFVSAWDEARDYLRYETDRIPKEQTAALFPEGPA